MRKPLEKALKKSHLITSIPARKIEALISSPTNTPGLNNNGAS